MNILSRSVVVFCLFTAACSTSSSIPAPPCNVDPFTCPTGQTCWATNTMGDFACLNSGPGALGAPCENTVGAPTCKDGLLCVQTSAAEGSCLAYCDPTSPEHACAGGAACETVELIGTSDLGHVCVPAATPVDAGDG
jgi:hypothetical protein